MHFYLLRPFPLKRSVTGSATTEEKKIRLLSSKQTTTVCRLKQYCSMKNKIMIARQLPTFSQRKFS